MKRLAAGLVAAAAVVLVGAGAQPDPYKELDAFREKALAERKKLGLDHETARARFPTPELSLVGRSEPIEARPGETVEVKAEGPLADGAFVTFGGCPELVVSTLKQTKEGVTATVKIPPAQLPTQCNLIAVAPVSAIQLYLPAINVVGTYEWGLKLANGMSLKALTRTDPEDGFAGDAEWFDQGKSLGKRRVRITGSADAPRLEFERTDAELQQLQERLQASAAKVDTEGIMKQVSVLTEKMQKECMGLPTAQMTPCIQKYQQQMQKLTAPLREASSEMNADSDIHPNACLTMSLELKGGKLTGTGRGCRTTAPVDVTGTVTARK